MSSSADALNIVQSLVKRTRNARLSYPSLVAYAEKYLARAADEDPSLEDFADNPANLMTAYLVELEKEGAVELKYVDGTISSVSYPKYYTNVVEAIYERIEEQAERPFPTEDSLAAPIPSDLITPVDVKSDFVRWIARSESSSRSDVLRLMFPDGIHSMLVTTHLLSRSVPKLAVQKIRTYLRSERNAGYMRSKLASIFRQREMAMKDMLSGILTTPDQALRTIFNPTDFTFHFWTQLSSTIIKEYSQKKDKLVEEHGYCQAAYLIGYYNVHHRGVQQRTRERETALRQLENRLRQTPYTFTISEIHGFTDQRGVPLTKKYSVEDVNHYIADQVKPGDDTSLPQMIRLRCADGGEYYLYRDYVPQVAVDHVFTARKEMRDHYVDSWKESLQQNRRLPEMTDDDAFEKDVAVQLKEADPLLHTLLNYNLLYLSRQEVNVPADLAAELDEIFHPKEPQLRPLPEILNLERRKLLTDAKLLLPFWQAVPIISSFVSFLKRVFLGASEDERADRRNRKRRKKNQPPAVAASGNTNEAPTTVRYSPDGSAPAEQPAAVGTSGSSAASRRAQTARFKDAVRDLQKQYVRPGSTPERTLAELADRWNPLLDPVAQENLVEDINSLARDFLRRMKVSFRLIPPTKDRVNEWADRLCENEAFHQIRRREDLKEYLKLYMLTVLTK
ncbi:MAG TPA: hypothetical protein VKA06_01685 [Spirochaetia bacterium]|nr:hypothetical protein [Spirochaetia bacterium]